MHQEQHLGGERLLLHICVSFSRTSLASEAFHEVEEGSRVNSRVIPADQCSHVAP